jgi:hypothetical protein
VSALTAQEQGHVRTALRYLHARSGTWLLVAKIVGGVKESTVSRVAQGHKAASSDVAVRVARAVKVAVDDVLSGRFPAPGACPHCGQIPPKPDPAREFGGAP